MKNKLNEGFICQGCSFTVSPANKTSRNHCPRCFLSLHVDGAVPGDRDTECMEFMVPVSYFTKNGTTKITFLCTQCGKKHNNKIADDDQLGQLDMQIAKWKAKFKHLFL